MKTKCYDCGKSIEWSAGITVGRMSCKNIWTKICKECDDEFNNSKGGKKVKALIKQINNIKTNKDE